MKYSFGYKKWRKTNSISFPRSSEAIHIIFTRMLSRSLTRRIHIGWIAFLYSFLGNQKQNRKYRFWLQKRVKIQKDITFEKFGGWLYNDSALIFDVKSLWKDLQPKITFFFSVLCIKTKKKILVTKSGQNLNLMTFSNPRPKYCILHFYFAFEVCASLERGWSRNFGKDGLPSGAKWELFSANYLVWCWIFFLWKITVQSSLK